jgi:hypothetical protein
MRWTPGPVEGYESSPLRTGDRILGISKALLISGGLLIKEWGHGREAGDVDALIRANKDFDLLIMPTQTHGCWKDPYLIRRAWDYFGTTVS